MHAYGVPWGSSITSLTLHKLLTSFGNTRGLVLSLYLLFLEASYKRLPVVDIWLWDIYGTDSVVRIEIYWDSIWANLKHVSKNPNHQLVHFKMIHRMFLSPRKHHYKE